MRPEDVVAFGRRDNEEAARYGSAEPPAELAVLNLAYIRQVSAEQAIAQALASLARTELNGFWVHVDADVLDDDLLPAVDYRLPGGLSWMELQLVLSSAAASGQMVGLDLTVFNPALESTGSRRARSGPDHRCGAQRSITTSRYSAGNHQRVLAAG